MGAQLPLNFTLSFCREMVPDHGEDCQCHAFCDTAGLIGVFDGCGGAGARKHACYSDNTEAYMASRLCAVAFHDCFHANFPEETSVQRFVEERLTPGVSGLLRQFHPPREEGAVMMRGSMVRTLPTTAAAAVVRMTRDQQLLVNPIWAGDSRVYVLDANGLAQLTVDDTTVPDPMENLYEDGLLKNVLCSDREASLHLGAVRLPMPAMVLAATDGCFGYVSTPMEFEGMLLATLLVSQSPADWEEKLSKLIGHFAGDDHTLCLSAFGYPSFEALKKAMEPRYRHLKERYLDKLKDIPTEDRQPRRQMWQEYRPDYCRYMERD